MRLVSFTLLNDRVPRVGVLAHDGARVIDLTEIGAASIAEGAARAGRLSRVASHLLHMPGAVAHLPAAVRLGAAAARLALVYDAATGAPAAPLAAGPAPLDAALLAGPEGAVTVPPGSEFGAGIACVLSGAADGIEAAGAEAVVAGLALLACWRAPRGHVAGAVVGPWLVTPDELSGGRSAPLAFELQAAVAVNGEALRAGSWAALTARLARAVADASARAPLAAGDAVGVATFELARDGQPGTGATPGDAVVLEAEHLGVLRAFVAPGWPTN